MVMAIQIIEVTPSEIYKHTEPFVDDVPSGATISTRAVSAVSSGGTVVTSTVITGAGGSGTDIVFTFTSGVDFEDYRVVARATLSTGAVVDHTLAFRVRTNPRT
jgi:hypothetical protein